MVTTADKAETQTSADHADELDALRHMQEMHEKEIGEIAGKIAHIKASLNARKNESTPSISEKTPARTWAAAGIFLTSLGAVLGMISVGLFSYFSSQNKAESIQNDLGIMILIVGSIVLLFAGFSASVMARALLGQET